MKANGGGGPLHIAGVTAINYYFCYPIKKPPMYDQCLCIKVYICAWLSDFYSLKFSKIF